MAEASWGLAGTAVTDESDVSNAGGVVDLHDPVPRRVGELVNWWVGDQLANYACPMSGIIFTGGGGPQADQRSGLREIRQVPVATFRVARFGASLDDDLDGLPLVLVQPAVDGAGARGPQHPRAAAGRVSGG